MFQTKRLAVVGMLSAMCAVLGLISVDLGNLKFTFESFPILIAALLGGPLDGFLTGALGTLIYQLLRYGISATTILWILPYALCGALVGAYAYAKRFSLSRRQLYMTVIINELLISVINTVVLYIDSMVYGYYNPVYIFGSIAPRFIVCLLKAVVFAAVLPTVLHAVSRAMHTSASERV